MLVLSLAGLAICAAAIVVRSAVSRFRDLNSTLAQREELLRQLQSGAHEQHRLLLEQIGEHERDNERLRDLFHFDALTGLPNRRFFLERLEQVMADARAQRFDIAVLAVDVDRLRMVNGSLGHRVGDKVLETVASRLQQILRHVDTVARSTSDEFRRSATCSAFRSTA
jgi:PleD family two-component response regulator